MKLRSRQILGYEVRNDLPAPAKTGRGQYRRWSKWQSIIHKMKKGESILLIGKEWNILRACATDQRIGITSRKEGEKHRLWKI